MSSVPPEFTRPSANEPAYSGPGEAAPHDFAVLYQGEFETLWDGTAVAVRAHARALAGAGIPVLLKSFSGTIVDEFGTARPVFEVGLPVSVQAEVGHLEHTRAKATYPVIKHAVIRDAEHLRQIVLPRGIIGKDIEEQASLRAHVFASTIVYSVWERDRVDPGIAKILSRVAECWVPSTQNAQMLASSGVSEDRISVIPHPYDETDPIRNLQKRRVSAHEGWRKFYSIGRWEPRKGYAELIEAFLEAFLPSEKVVLTIKYTGGHWPDYESPEQVITRCLSYPSFRSKGWTLSVVKDRVRLIGGRFPRAAILKLHYKNNIYISSSHGEAWGLPAFEAVLAGNQLVYVPSGGVEDFVGIGHIAVRPSEPKLVPLSYKWESGAEWMGYSIESLAEALRKASIPATHAPDRGFDREAYTLATVGALMKQRVLAVVEKGRHPEAQAYYGGLWDSRQ